MRIVILGIIWLVTFFSAANFSYAIEDPLKRDNNIFGIHILFPAELEPAAKLVNSNGGDWGYVTIPIQAGDKDLKKWQDFMDRAKKLHLIPLIRLSTEGDYFNTTAWRKPIYTDVLDFANFLNSLSWPTKNRYIIIFNEVNRNDEWGGQANPEEYANILSYAVTIFKEENSNFFIISAGLDNAAANSATAFNQYYFLTQMDKAIPGVFNQIDGIASHAYPNPGFAQPPSVSAPNSIASFIYEEQLIEKLSSKQLPVFITETGWSLERVSEENITNYFITALNTTWKDSSLVAITPFLLQAGAGPFTQFSFIKPDGSYSLFYQAIHDFAKIAGKPTVTKDVLAAETHVVVPTGKKFFVPKKNSTNAAFFSFKTFMHWLFYR